MSCFIAPTRLFSSSSSLSSSSLLISNICQQRRQQLRCLSHGRAIRQRLSHNHRTLLSSSSLSSLLTRTQINRGSSKKITGSTTGTSFSTTTTTPEVGVVHVTIEEAKHMTTMALQKIGWDNEDATLQAEIMTAAELCGNNQGLVKMYQPQLMAPSPDYQGKPIVTQQTLDSAVINARQSPGMLAAITAADLVVAKLRRPNEETTSTDSSSVAPPPAIAIVSTYNSGTSSGQLGYYVERMAIHGNIIGIAMANSPEFVAAAAGATPTLGTNPIAFSIPTKDYPFTFDMATSAIALFGVLSAKAKGEALPPHVAYDKHGNWTTDASQVLDDGGAIATFGGHKGMGLSLIVELLAGALSGSAVLGQVESKRSAKSWGHTFIGIRPEALTDNFNEKATSILSTVAASGAAVRLPGDRSAQTAKKRKEIGIMPIPEKIWESILYTAEHGLPKPTKG